MSMENAERFLKKVLSDDDLRKNVSEKEYEEIVSMAKGMGYDFSAEELKSVVDEYRKNTGNPDAKLKAEDLDSFAGGALWMGEDASDGHEMGCVFAWHLEDWCKEHDEYCKDDYYCKGTEEHYVCSGGFHTN